MNTTHKCPVAGCGVELPRKMLMCARHWGLVGKQTQKMVWHYWKNGLSGNYLDFRKRAIAEAEAADPVQKVLL